MILDAIRARNQGFVGVCSYGRSGSTLLMALLRAVGLSVVGGSPFEDRTTQASFLAWLRLTMGESRAGAAAPGARTFETFQGITYKSALDTNVARVRDLGEQYAGFLEQILRPEAPGLAEKYVGVGVLRLMKAFDFAGTVKPIFLVRDPRDVFISVKKFNEKRGSKDFAEAGGDASLFTRICDFERMQVAEAGRSGALLCHYEDLLARRPQTLVALLQYIGVRAISEELVQRAWGQLDPDDAARVHMTSASQRDSIARWRQDEFAGYRPLFAAQYDSVLRVGYL